MCARQGVFLVGGSCSSQEGFGIVNAEGSWKERLSVKEVVAVMKMHP